MTDPIGPCIWKPCVATWQHWHGGFPGGYDDPADPTGPPIAFEGDEPDEGVRDYNGAPLRPTHSEAPASPSGDAGPGLRGAPAHGSDPEVDGEASRPVLADKAAHEIGLGDAQGQSGVPEPSPSTVRSHPATEAHESPRDANPGAVSSPRGGSGDLPLQPGFGS